MRDIPTVHILLATYNGGRFIAEQLASIERQSYRSWTLTVSDDGSTDDTLTIVQEFAKRVPQRVTVLEGPHKGSTHNFFHLINHVSANTPRDLFAFCDQDDVWLHNKLERAVQWHNQHQSQNVRLYCGRTQFVDEHLKPIGLSPGIHRPPSFGNALVQNIASGNTMVMSQALLKTLKCVKSDNSVWHDWTTYLIATSVGGLVHFDKVACLLYRQHGDNIIGSNNGVSNIFKDYKKSFEGRFKERITLNLAALKSIQNLMSSSAGKTVSHLQCIRANKSKTARLLRLIFSNIRKQSALSSALLLFAAFANKL